MEKPQEKEQVSGEEPEVQEEEEEEDQTLFETNWDQEV